MNKKIKLAALFALVIFALSSCDNSMHNGTEMLISEVVLSGLPDDPYAVGQEMIFSYNDGTKWVHDDLTDYDAKFLSTVDADGTITFTFTENLMITTPVLQFILIDPDTQWDSFQIDTKHSGGKGGDVELDNKWSGSSSPQIIEGTVDGESITWVYQGD